MSKLRFFPMVLCMAGLMCYSSAQANSGHGVFYSEVAANHWSSSEDDSEFPSVRNIVCAANIPNGQFIVNINDDEQIITSSRPIIHFSQVKNIEVNEGTYAYSWNLKWQTKRTCMKTATVYCRYIERMVIRNKK